MAGHSHIKMWIISTLLLMSFVHPSLANVKKEAKYLILGAGAGGLHAARLLLAQNITDFIILEGTNQIGGRSERSVDFGGITFNPGDMFVYGNIDYLQRLGFGLQKYDFAFWEVRNDQGEDITPEANTRDGILYAAKEATNDLAEGVVKHERPDIDQKTAMAMKGWLAKSPLDEIVQWYYFDFDQGIQMKRESLVGTYRQSLQSDYYLITDYGASGLFSDVEQQLDEEHLHLGEVVVKIDQSGDKVIVTTGNTPSEEEEYVADYVLVTFSLGVLQQGEVTFIPPLPEWKTEQLCRYQRGTIEGVLLRFASKFWSDAEWILHASDRQDVDYHHYPAFLNVDREGMHPGSNILVAILTGEEAIRVEGLSDEEIMEEVLNVLRNMYGEENVSELQEMYFERWATNPFSYGTFDTWPVLANIPPDAHERLAANVGHVFFAQQASSYENIGLTVGTIEASSMAVSKMLYCGKTGGDCPEGYESTGSYWSEMECDERDDRELHGCVMIKKKEGKTRKVNTFN